MVSEYGYAPDAITLYGPDQDRGDDRRSAARPGHHHQSRLHPCGHDHPRAARAGVDVVVEKPLTIDAPRHSPSAAVKETGHQVVVTFNYRYSPRNSALKELIAFGTDRHAALDDLRVGARHGPRSGLLPALASGQGELGRPADPQGEPSLRPDQLVAGGCTEAGLRVRRGEVLRFRCRGLPRAATASPAGNPRRRARPAPELDLRDDPRLKALYLDNEQYDGYHRDQTCSPPVSPPRTTWP